MIYLGRILRSHSNSVSQSHNFNQSVPGWIGCLPRACAFVLVLIAITLFSAGCSSTKVASTPSNTSSYPASGKLAPSNSALNFGNVPTGSTITMSLVLTNTGTQSSSVEISNITVSGIGFGISGGTAPVTLTTGQSVTLNVTFNPSKAGGANGSVTIASSATNSALSVTLSGTGMNSGQLVVNPTTFNFPSVALGSSQSQQGMLTAGSSNITVSTTTWNGSGFSVSGISFPVTIPAGQSIPFTVSFAPQAAATALGTISFVSNATNSPTTESLTGTGIQASTQHSVSLNWNADTSTVQGYYVYRGTQNGGPYARISALQSGTSYTDAAVIAATTYYYVVTAVATNSVESGYSNQVVAVVP